jgi:hypoxanthine phosphoribosyltransferase
MIDKVYYTWKDIEHMIVTINNLMFADNWRPDYIVGMTRGGLVPAVMMSNSTGIKMYALDVRFRDVTKDNNPESNKKMAADAYAGKNILILDDINDSGRTFQWIKDDWNIKWGTNVRTAALVDNGSSNFGEVDYTALEINKMEKDVWVVFPWEGERDYGNI